MDAESFKREFLPCHQKLYRTAYRLLENVDDAEDIVQEAYLKLWNKREELVIVRNPESFCVVIVKNLCFDAMRTAKSYIGGEKLESLGLLNEVPLTTEIEIKDDLNCVKALIDQLPEQQRKVMILRHLNECSIEEIELATGLNAINIRVLLSRARKKIREQFYKMNKNEND